jgi:hypothetical protein
MGHAELSYLISTHEMRGSFKRKEGYQRSDISDQEAGIERRNSKSEKRKSRRGTHWDGAAIPPLRGPTRQKAARKEKSGRSGRDDKIGETTRASGRDDRVKVSKSAGGKAIGIEGYQRSDISDQEARRRIRSLKF